MITKDKVKELLDERDKLDDELDFWRTRAIEKGIHPLAYWAHKARKGNRDD